MNMQAQFRTKSSDGRPVAQLIADVYSGTSEPDDATLEIIPDQPLSSPVTLSSITNDGFNHRAQYRLSLQLSNHADHSEIHSE